VPSPTDSPLVTVDRTVDGVAIVTLNRPERLNALSFALVDELHDALDQIQRDNDCRVVVLTGAGKGFCSGLDLTSIEGSSTSQGATGPRAGILSQEHIAALPVKIRNLQQPVIAAVNGAAFGGGFALALACDIRFASTSARFCSQFIKLGIGGCDIGISYTLPQVVGSGRAAELLLTAREVSAAEALELGIVADVVEDDVVQRALEAASLIRDYSPFAVMMTKEVIWANADASSLESAIHLENRTQILAATGGEVMEAAAAFREKRKPDWNRAGSWPVP
jgi:enoyl-CoA hydratase